MNMLSGHRLLSVFVGSLLLALSILPGISEAQVAPPVLSLISSGVPTSNSATVTWTTDEPSDSTVNYGTTSSYGSTSYLSALTTAHSVTLTGLTASSTYHFQVSSADSSGNLSTSTDQTFITTPVLSPQIMIFGDSRANNAGGILSHTGGANYTSEIKPSGTWAGCIPQETNNSVYFAPDYNFGVGAQSTAGFVSRYATASYATTGGTASNFIGTKGAITSTDNEFNIATNALYSSITDPSNVLLFMGGVNDGAIGPPTPHNKQSMTNIATLLDAWRAAGKVVFLSNELPNGVATAYNEIYTIPAGGGSYTTTHASVYYKDSFVEYMPQPGGANDGVKLTLVSSNPGVGQYSVSNGVYTFSAADAGATVGINYSYLDYNRTGTALQGKIALHNWLSSNAADFVDPASGVDYGIPGALYNRSWIVPVDTWDTIADPTASSSALNLPGTLLDGLHPTIYGCQLVASAYASALSSRLPATNYMNAPTTGDAELLDTANGTKTAYASTDTVPAAKPFKNLPITPGTFTLTAGSIVATDNGSGTLTGTGIISASSTINYATGSWKVAFTTAPKTNTKIYGATDSSNLILNGLLTPVDGFSPITTMSGCTGSCLTSGNLTSANNTGIPAGYTASIDAGTSGQLASGAMKMDISLSTTTPDGYPEMAVTLSGKTSTSSMAITFSQNTIQNLVLGQKYRSTAVAKVDPGPNGHLYGLTGIVTRAYCMTPAGGSFTPAGETALISNGTGSAIYSGLGWNQSGGMQLSDLDVANGELRIPILTQSCDTTGMSGTPTGNFAVVLTADPNTEISATVHLSRLSMEPYSY